MAKKKIVRCPDDLNYGFSGASSETFIRMWIQKFEVVEMPDDRKALIENSYPEATAAMLEDGRIVVDSQEIYELFQKEEDAAKITKENERKVNVALKLFCVAMFLLLIPSVFINEYIPNILLGMVFIFYAMSGVHDVCYAFFAACFGSERFRKMHRNHYAEHAAINAYYDLRRVPTLDEIKNYSGFAYDCEVSAKFRNVWWIFVIGVCRMLPGIWYVVALAIVLFLNYIFRKEKLYWTEIFTLLKPTDNEYRVAIAALQKAVSYMEDIDSMEGVIPIFATGDNVVAHIVVSFRPEEDT